MGDRHFYAQIKHSAAQRDLPDTALPPEFKSVGGIAESVTIRAHIVRAMALALYKARIDPEDEPRCLEFLVVQKSPAHLTWPREVVLDCIADARARAAELIKQGVSIDV